MRLNNRPFSQHSGGISVLVGFCGTVIPSEDVVGSQSCFKSLVLSSVFVLLSIFHQVNTNLN